jgi:uncharacterized protein YjbI with pentapeptide repeats
MNSRLKQYLLYASIIIVGGSLLFVLIETVRAKNTGFETKTLWDWMQLLVIPFVLAIGAFFLNRSERAVEREIATDRQQEAALQAYLDRMADLLLRDKLRTTKKREVLDVARVRTLTLLTGLDGKRKGDVIKFLREAALISYKKPVIELWAADLSGAFLQGAYLKDADLHLANLQLSNLKLALLQSANLNHANLEGSNLSRAFLIDDNLEHANLRDSDLRGSYLRHAICNILVCKVPIWKVPT